MIYPQEAKLLSVLNGEKLHEDTVKERKARRRKANFRILNGLYFNYRFCSFVFFFALEQSELQQQPHDNVLQEFHHQYR